ncbi:MAG: hypothetical protein ACE361_00800 [Aureliella sp.]
MLNVNQWNYIFVVADLFHHDIHTPFVSDRCKRGFCASIRTVIPVSVRDLDFAWRLEGCQR